MGQQEQDINNYNISNIKYKMKIQKEKCDSGYNNSDQFCLNFPPELYPYISTQDYCNIIAQLNHYKKGYPYRSSGTIFGLFIYPIMLFFVVFFRSINSSITLFLASVLITIAITHIILIDRSRKNFYNEITAYLEFLNRLYTNLTFEGTFIHKSLREVEISISNTILLSPNDQYSLSAPSSLPVNNKYNRSILCGFKFLVEEKLQFAQYYYNTNINQNQTQKQNQTLTTPINNNNNITTIDIDISNYQYQQPQQPQIFATNNPVQVSPPLVNEYRTSTIQELLTPSDAELFYTQKK